MAKFRKLKRVRIDELSFVDRPASGIPFMFWKNADGKGVHKAMSTQGINPFANACPKCKSTKVENVGDKLTCSKCGNEFVAAKIEKMKPACPQCGSTNCKPENSGMKCLDCSADFEAGEFEKRVMKCLGVELDMTGADADTEKKIGEHAAVIEKYLDDLPIDCREAVQGLALLAAGPFAEACDKEAHVSKEDDRVDVDGVVAKLGETIRPMVREEVERTMKKIAAQAAEAQDAAADPEVEVTPEQLAEAMAGAEQEALAEA